MKLITVITFIFLSLSAYGQSFPKIGKDITSIKILNPDRHDGLGIQISLVAMFSAGVVDRNGFRLGGGVTLYQDIGDWRLSIGADAYKAKQKFGLGTSFAGFSYNDGRYGGSYYVNRYYQGDKQTSAILGIRLHDFHIAFEDDILALPFTGFVLHDRYRTAALELRYKRFLIGTNVYTNEANGMTDASLENGKGIYATGKQISSPVYLGFTTNNLILRYGINSRLGGYVGQNWWHQAFFDTTDFKSGDYRNQFFQVGVNKPYTLY
ncbi:polymorphic toxin type 23 domain-containing protein [Dysgonomonas sp. 520]|uniref:polymorphic toxin type 23 domain-containing protein n=1 Tax=Dysgonomonas sp. 520 TaxID=2302931 RepID=UPI0013D20C40|nr:polymorphic toxin type 23 domain-containing protein [Dysgonomonas sp. 520]NDW09048.1 hypothetical protein [Dysgonomonas sp. 520]